MKYPRLLAALIGTLAIGGTARAQDPDPDPPTASEPDVRWPRSVIVRPLTLPRGLVMLGADISSHLVNDEEPFFDPATIRVLAGVGITNNLELGFAHYQFQTNDVGAGRIDMNVGYTLERGAMGGTADAVARVQVGYNFGGPVDLSTGESAGEIEPLGLGIQLRYHLTSRLVLLTPGNQLRIGIESPHLISLDVPVGIGYQATQLLYAQLETQLVHINIKDAGPTTVFFADHTPIAITGTYNVMPALDVTAGLALDLNADPIGDSFTILVGGRYYLGAGL